MGVLDQIMQMKSQGISDEEIVSELSQQGISPRQINDALKQAQIKSVVSNGYNNNEDMQASMMQGEEPPAPEQETYQPSYQPQQQYAPQEEVYQPQMQGQEQAYQAGGYEQYAPAGIDTDTVMEIADQIFSDRIKKFQKQLDSVTETSTLLQTKMENISERFRRIETIIDKLQLAILEKVGSYGRNLDSIKKEMSMMQDSFSKMISSPREQRKSERQPREEYSAPEETNEEVEETPEEEQEETETQPEKKRIISRTQKKFSKKR